MCNFWKKKKKKNCAPLVNQSLATLMIVLAFVLALHACQCAIVAHYDFVRGNGGPTIVPDLSGQGNDLTIGGNAKMATSCNEQGRQEQKRTQTPKSVETQLIDMDIMSFIVNLVVLTWMGACPAPPAAPVTICRPALPLRSSKAG